MMSENTNLQRQLALFVDGELKLEDENLFLAQCEAEPSRYRELALALVEQRRLRMALVGLELTANSASRATVPWAGEKESRYEVLPVAKPVKESRLPSRSPKRSTWLLGLAASLLIGVSAGYWVIAPQQKMSNESATRADDLASWEVPQSATGDSLRNALVEDRSPVSRRDSEPQRHLPNTPDSLVRFVRNLDAEPIFPDEMMRELDADGLAVEQDSRVFVIDMPDGRRLAFPAQITNVSQRSH